MRKHRQERAQQQLVFGGGVDAVPLRVSALNDSTAAAPMSAWMTASQAIQFLRPRSTGAAIALPIAMPASTQASMIVNAYAVGAKTIRAFGTKLFPAPTTSHRRQRTPTAQSLDEVPEVPEVPGVPGVPGVRGGGSWSSWSSWYQRLRREARSSDCGNADQMLVVAAIWNERATPISAMK